MQEALQADLVHLRLRQRRTTGKLLRVGALVGVFTASAVANHAVGLGCWESVFAGLQSFALGLDTVPPPDVMAAGGPWTQLLWATRIAAPLIAAESVLFAALLAGVIARPAFLLVDHVIVVGAGNLGRTVVEQIMARAALERTPLEVVVVDVDPDAPHLKELGEQGVWTVIGDGQLPSVLHEARVERARAVVIVTSSDVANVAALWNARARCPKHARILVHVDDEHLRDTVRETLGPDPDVELFNLYEEAGRRLVADQGLDRPGPASVVIAGFGRLGRAIQRQLGVDRCLVVDRDPSIEVPPRRPGDAVLHGCVQTPAVLEGIAGFLREGAPTAGRFVFVATDQDVRNLDLALGLHRKLGALGLPVTLSTRMLRPPRGDVAVLEKIGVVSLAAIVAESERFGLLCTRTRHSFRATIVQVLALVSWWTGAL